MVQLEDCDLFPVTDWLSSFCWESCDEALFNTMGLGVQANVLSCLCA